MSKRILVIDDSSTIQKVIRIAFAPYEVRVDTAGHFVDGLNAARQLKPDLILADANLAGVKSVNDFQRLATEAHGVPLMLLYGSYDKVDEQLFREAGFSTFIRKPFDSSDIVANVKHVLGHDLPRKAAASSAAAPNVAAQATTPSQPAAQGKRHVMDGLLGGFAPKTKVVTQPDPIPVKEEPTDWMHAAEPHIEIPRDLDEGMDALVMEGLLSQNLTDNKRKGERAFAAGFTTTSTRPGMMKISADKEEQIESAPLPNLPPLPKEALQDAGSTRAAAVKEPETIGFKAPTPEELTGLLRPILREELGRMVAEAVDEYCDKHFPGVARDVISAEIRRLTEEKTRHLVD